MVCHHKYPLPPPSLLLNPPPPPFPTIIILHLFAYFEGPPSVARNLQVLESRTRANTITVMWERPLIIGRDDYFYNIQYSNPDIPGSFVQHNSNPLITTSPVVRYSLSGLRPQTRYTIRLSVLSGVSDQDSAGEEGRRSEVMATTGDISKYMCCRRGIKLVTQSQHSE